jgi:hypothetical protein
LAKSCWERGIAQNYLRASEFTLSKKASVPVSRQWNLEIGQRSRNVTYLSGGSKVRHLKFLALLAVLVLPAAYSQAQVAIGVQIGPSYGIYNAPPVCEYGFYPDYPYACAPYGYWGPEYFAEGIFIGVGPWDHFYYTRPTYYRSFYFNRGFGFRGGDRFRGDRDRGFRDGGGRTFRNDNGRQFRNEGGRTFRNDSGRQFRNDSGRTFRNDNGRGQGSRGGSRSGGGSNVSSGGSHGNGGRGSSNGSGSHGSGGRGSNSGRGSHDGGGDHGGHR